MKRIIFDIGANDGKAEVNIHFKKES